MKDENKNPQNSFQKLTGSPSATAVSDVAKGGEPKTDDEMDKAYQELNGEVRQGIKPEMEAIDCTDLEEAYANLIESLSVIMRSKK